MSTIEHKRVGLERTHHVVTFLLRRLHPSALDDEEGEEEDAPTMDTTFDFNPATVPAFLRTTAVAGRGVVEKLIALNINAIRVGRQQHVFNPPKSVLRDGVKLEDAQSHTEFCTRGSFTPGVHVVYLTDALTTLPAHAGRDCVAFVSILMDTAGLSPDTPMVDVPAEAILAYAIFCVGIPDHTVGPSAYDLFMYIDVVAARAGHGTRMLDYLASRFEGPPVPANKRYIELHSINYSIATDERGCANEEGFSLNKFYSSRGYANATSCTNLVEGQYAYSGDGNEMVNCLGHERAFGVGRLAL